MSSAFQTMAGIGVLCFFAGCGAAMVLWPICWAVRDEEEDKEEKRDI